ncbi:hypothetical protein L7F22_044486 [Adiantum nelumboides]|nr:hypothetical protein [Adiantum nelumboides]
MFIVSAMVDSGRFVLSRKWPCGRRRVNDGENLRALHHDLFPPVVLRHDKLFLWSSHLTISFYGALSVCFDSWNEIVAGKARVLLLLGWLSAKSVDSSSMLACPLCQGDFQDLFGSKLSFENSVPIEFVVVKVDNFVKSDGESVYRLVIADSPNSLDKAMLLFVPSRRQEYHHIVSNLQERSFYACVVHNINIFCPKGNTLSIVDATILCDLPANLELHFRNVLGKQLALHGYGKKCWP